MPKVRRKNVRANKKRLAKQPKIENKFRWCTKEKYWVYKGVCEKKCKKRSCPIRIKIVKKERDKELKKRKKQFEKEGITRSLLLRPEDRIDV